MITVGLTGGIATGKSTVSRFFVDYGAYLVDTDRISREIVEPGTDGWREVVDAFGEGVLCEDRRLDRKKIGEIVFRDQERRRLLESILHPRVFREKKRRIEKIQRYDKRAIIVIDIPLLIEVNRQQAVNKVVLVYVSPHVQLERLVVRDGYGLEDARSRIACQMPIDEKIRYADYVINNEGPLERTQEIVGEVYRKLHNDEAALWAGKGDEHHQDSKQ